MMSQNPELDNKPIDQWKVAELREELRRRKLVTKGLKEELVKRLDEAIQKEMDSGNGVELGDGTEFVESNAVSQNSDEEDLEPEREDNTQSLSDEGNKNDKDVVMVDNNDCNVNVNHGGEDQNGNVDKVSCLARTDEEKAATTDDLEDGASGEQIVITQSDMRAEHVEHAEKYEDPNEDTVAVHSEQSYQVSEISQDLGLQVKYESISTDSVSIDIKNNVKDNLNADNFPLELEVAKQEVVQPSSISYPSDGEDSCVFGDEQATGTNCVTDEQEADKNLVSDGQEMGQNILSDKQEETNNNAYNEQIVAQNSVSVQQPVRKEHASLEVADTHNSLIVDHPKKEDNADVGSPEKLNLDRSSGDESMEEDLLESKHLEAGIKSKEPVVKIDDNKVDVVLEQKPFVDAVDKFSHEIKDISVEAVKPIVPTEKRKLEETEVVGNNVAPKRQRRWNTESIKSPQVPEQQTLHMSIPTPKNTVQPELRRTFSRSNSTLSGESFKERFVPTPKKPATTSLRIDNFLRPFTLKAVQELLAKTGEVCDFWMDHIKTHCYVTYSSAEEATETRNAVYNLQWPPNGGRHLAAEFVDPQDVKMRSEAPPQSPATPVTPSPATPKAPPPPPPQTQTPRPQNLGQQPLPPPPPLAQLLPPPPPLLSNPPIGRERLPPPPPKKPDPPVLTLDDLFKKTKATPWIYYLPLPEEQVSAKLAAQGKSNQLH